MAKMTPRTLSGFMELLPAPQQQMERIMEVLRKTYSLYGFRPAARRKSRSTAFRRATATSPSALT